MRERHEHLQRHIGARGPCSVRAGLGTKQNTLPLTIESLPTGSLMAAEAKVKVAGCRSDPNH